MKIHGGGNVSLKSVQFKKAYSSDYDDILNRFYIPVLKESIEYDRFAGFFSSSSLAVSARGILGLIDNGGHMKLVVSPKLTKDDVKVLIDAYEHPEKYVEQKMMEELDNIEDLFIKDHVSVLGWMVANEKLDLKVAISYDKERKLLSYEEIQERGIFHQKVGILKDPEGNIITFSGSVNETAAGWLENIEEFKVFRSWIPTESEYVDVDVKRFNRFWENKSPKMRVIDLPLAVRDKLIEIAPKNIDYIDLGKWYKRREMDEKKKIVLREHQKNAVEKWLENGMKGIFEMATGTGKTFTALGCLNEVLRYRKKLLVVISVPYQHLIQQWKREINKFDVWYDDLIIASSANPSWKNDLMDVLIDFGLGGKNKVIVLTTHSTFSSSSFIKLIDDIREKTDIFLIGDEVHSLGSKERRNGLIEKYNIKLGLSATPRRWFDTEGTKILYDYFGDVIFEFGLKEAIDQGYLTPYRYIPEFVSLTGKELDDYIELTSSVLKRYNATKNNKEKDEILEILLFKRAEIVKNAQKKYEVLKSILDTNKNIEHAIIYSTPQQIDNVMNIVNIRGIPAHRFTMDEGTIPKKEFGGKTERDFILEKFIEKKYKVLVAMKCLDEGVDVPPARMAVLMASSGNPREYIQRIGRIIRRYPGKNEATIYDIIVKPSFSGPSEMKDFEQRIFNNELKRCEEIAKIAINSAEALELIYSIKKKLRG